MGLSSQIQTRFSFISGVRVILPLKADKGIVEPATGEKGTIPMHDIEHESAQNDSVVEVPHVQPQAAEDTSTPVQKGITTIGRQKLPRAWRYIIIGGTMFLVLAVIFAGLLSLANQRANQSPHTGKTPVTGASPFPTSTVVGSTLPTPATTPIPAPVPSGHNVSVTIADGVAYLSTTDNAVYALRTSNGALLWRHQIDGSAYVRPLVRNGVVYVTSFVDQGGPGYAYALRASDGSLLWRYTSGGYSYLSPSTTDSSVVYVASQEGISALKTSTGTLLWHFVTRTSASWWPLEVNGIVYVSSSINGGPGTLYALRTSDGTLLWQYKTSGFINTPAVANGVVYVPNGGMLVALRATNGHQLWKLTLDANLIQSPQLVNGVLYTTVTKILEPSATRSAAPLQGTTAIGALLWNTLQSAPAKQTVPHKQGVSSVYAVRAGDGTILWHYTMSNGGNSWANWFSVEHGVVYASAFNSGGMTDAGDIYALQSSNGSVLWHDKLNASPYNATLANDIIYLSTSSGYTGAVYALRTSDGSLLWNYPIAGPIYDAPLLVGTAVYAGAANGMAYALRADNGVILWHYLTEIKA
jgi:outer membrane protein assembly factor BamB